MLSQASRAILTSKTPLVICGGGERYSGAGEALAQFCEAFHIPFGETQAGKSAVSWDNSWNMGGIGATGGLAANLLAKDADLVIGIGTRYTDFTTSSKWLFRNPDVQFLNINPGAFHAGKLDGIQVIADAKVALTALTKQLQSAGYHSGYSGEPSLAKAQWTTEINRLFATDYLAPGFKPEVAGHLDDKLGDYEKELGATLTQTAVLGCMQTEIDENSVVVGSSGSLPGDMQRIWLPRKVETYHMEYGYSCMGYEICGALGVKIAVPESEVYAMVGDGSFIMLHSELVTSLQMNHKIIIMLFDNAGFGCINNLQMSHGMGSFGTEFREGNTANGKVMRIDYAKIAEGYGAKGYRVNTLSELREAIADAKQQKSTVLLDIKVLPKTMTDGYESWWNTCAASVSQKESIRAVYEEVMQKRSEARKY
jgi:3D-(3,5/4)-trihydroxycyclohexane-1,2-dione acylhydrolase (decyclizing)